jgi:hypothetical protein
MARLVVGLCGNPGSGKSNFGKYLAEAHGFTAVESSQLIAEAAANAGRRLSARGDYDLFFREQQRAKGMAWLAKRALSIQAERLVLVGLRPRPDYLRLRRDGAIIIALACAPDDCLARMDRSNPKNPQNPAEYEEHLRLEASTDEYGAHTAWVMEHADHELDTARPEARVQADLDLIVASALRDL